MLEVREVGYRVGDRWLLREVSATFAPGTLSVVVGANGAGKSTLIRVMTGQLAASRGDVSYDGRTLSERAVADLARRRGVLSQNLELSFPLRAWEIVLMGRYPHFSGSPTARDEAAVEAAMRFFDIWDWADRDFLTLSGGERQRVHFARVLAQIWYPTPGSSRYLVLDEPLTFLDIRYQFEFLRKLRELLAQGDMVAIGVLHDLNLAARFADAVMMLRAGSVIAAGRPEAVLTPPHIRDGFGVGATVVQPAGGGPPQLIFE